MQTRYYDPTICRFINADNYELVAQLSVGELNMYAYCGNNPIMYTDETGEWILFATISFFVIYMYNHLDNLGHSSYIDRVLCK